PDRVARLGRFFPTDPAPGMSEERGRQIRHLVRLQLSVDDALALPAGDGQFDAATIAFGVRNLTDYQAGFRELARVVRSGGWVVCLELSLPRPGPIGRLYHGVFRGFAPLLRRVFR